MNRENPINKTPDDKEKMRKQIDSLGMGFAEDLAMDENRLHEKVQEEKEKAFIDGLTGLRNRKAMDLEIPERLNLDKRTEKNSSLLMLDIDHFKKVNDNYGHQKGDAVLKKIAEIIKRTCRKSDMVYRYGGEEMAVFLPDTNILGAQQIAEKIRDEIAKEEIEGLKITASLGCTNSSQFADLPIENKMAKLIEGADKALYESKRLDRNLVTIYSEKLEKKNNN